MDDIKFFSEVDMTKVGDKKIIGSKYPSWYFDYILEDLEDSIRMDERALENRSLTSRDKMIIHERLKRNAEKREAILEGKPKLSVQDENRLKKTMESIGKKITQKMFTRSQMMKGLASPNEEYKRAVITNIELDEDEMKLAKACNIRVHDGKVSRTRAEEMWKICRKYFGEPSNSEWLRKD